MSSLFTHDITTTEVSATLRYAPGEAFVNSSNAVFGITGCSGLHADAHFRLQGVLGGEYNFNRTEASIWKRFWLPSSWER